jgi:hypothetical protein
LQRINLALNLLQLLLLEPEYLDNALHIQTSPLGILLV